MTIGANVPGFSGGGLSPSGGQGDGAFGYGGASYGGASFSTPGLPGGIPAVSMADIMGWSGSGNDVPGMIGMGLATLPLMGLGIPGLGFGVGAMAGQGQGAGQGGDASGTPGAGIAKGGAGMQGNPGVDNLYNLGYSVEQIASMTGYPVQQVLDSLALVGIKAKSAGGAVAGGGGAGGASGSASGGGTGASAMASAISQATNALNAQKAQARKDLAPWMDPAFLQNYAGAVDAGPGEFTESPGYQFTLGEGQKAIERSAAARGMSQSPATQKALAQYATDLASKEYDSFLNRYYQSLVPKQDLANSSLRATLGLQGVEVPLTQTSSGIIAQDASQQSSQGWQTGERALDRTLSREISEDTRESQYQMQQDQSKSNFFGSLLSGAMNMGTLGLASKFGLFG